MRGDPKVKMGCPLFIVKIGVNQLIPSQEKLGLFFRCVLLVCFNGDRVGESKK